jgi:succinate-semialdehyde dehydrogenase/glutarate-semialdehyde dehydrogenase
MSDPAAPSVASSRAGRGEGGQAHGIAEFMEAKYVAVTF